MNLLSSPLLTDLYELTMLQAYFLEGMFDEAVFELFARKLPAGRNFLMAAGVEQAAKFLEGLRFGSEELDWLARSGHFRKDFVDWLADFRFEGDLIAMEEGTVVFENEPILQIVAPMPQAQLVESRLLNLVHFETMVASKAARCVLAASGRPLVDFGLRRAHGAEAGLLAARAAYIAGFAGTATTLAAAEFGIPAVGTMAHSYVQAHAAEAAAFEQFAQAFPRNAVLLIDTYDTMVAAGKVVELARRLQQQGIAVRGVRLDSGDLRALAFEVRRILDAAGLNGVIIFASGEIDEYRVRDLLASGAPIDSFGIGTSLVTSSDAPSVDLVYKLQEYAGRPCRKRSTGKATWPGRKQVCRFLGEDGKLLRDDIVLADEAGGGEPLLHPVLRRGKPVRTYPAMGEIRARAAGQLASLPDSLRRLEAAEARYPVRIAQSIRDTAEAIDMRT